MVYAVNAHEKLEAGRKQAASLRTVVYPLRDGKSGTYFFPGLIFTRSDAFGHTGNSQTPALISPVSERSFGPAVLRVIPDSLIYPGARFSVPARNTSSGSWFPRVSRAADSLKVANFPTLSALPTMLAHSCILYHLIQLCWLHTKLDMVSKVLTDMILSINKIHVSVFK